jgi:small conductance mechanosensitive channel
MEDQLAVVARFIDSVVDFAVAYGFQILGALVFLVIGLKVSSWLGNKSKSSLEARAVDPSLAGFIALVVKIILVAFVIIITLGNFGVSIAPLIALGGAVAFGGTLALQGPLSNFGAGLVILLTRPFVTGNTITVKNVSGLVHEIKLPATILIGEDGERITIPNREIVGEIIVNSEAQRVVETRIAVGVGEDVDRALDALRTALKTIENVGQDPAPQVGVHDFTYGGAVLGLRFWVPTSKYFQTRYAANQILLQTLKNAGIAPLPAGHLAVTGSPLSADEDLQT